MPEDYSRVLTKPDTRNVGYCIVEPPTSDDGSKRTSKAAIVYFYPLSGCSLVIANMAPALKNYQASLISVDRPSCAETSPLKAGGGGGDDDDDFALRRIRGHVQDVLAVLNHEGISEVYALGVCIGHPFAVELCCELLKGEETGLQLKGLTLVAPFVSTASPHSWHVARLGNSVPSFVLYGATEALVSIGSVLGPPLLKHKGPSLLKGLVSDEEKEEFGWTDEDFEKVCQTAVEMSNLTNGAKAVEARLGAVDTWQASVCDKFAVESGCGLVLDDDQQGGDTEEPVTSSQTEQESRPVIPIRIHACREDKVATFESVEWISRRCYGGCEFIVEERIHSHEVMTFFGGPPHNPVLMHKVARNWGLLKE